MNPGKLDNAVLKKLILDRFPKTRKESFGAPVIGEDCARLDLGGDIAVLSTDPITSAGIGQLGRLTVHVNCNDAAAAGAEPVGLMITLLIPPSESLETVERIAGDIATAARSANVDVLGGHTEVTDAVTRAVTNTTVIARCPKDRLLRGMRPGDDILLTKYAALEGTLLICEEKPDLLGTLSPDERATEGSLPSMLSVVEEGRYAAAHGATAMHDVTEGGVYGALWELAERYHCGVLADPEKIPLLPLTVSLCDATGLDPFRLMGSGSMLIACADGEALKRGLKEKGIPAAVIGKATEQGMRTVGGEEITPPGRDEFYRLFD